MSGRDTLLNKLRKRLDLPFESAGKLEAAFVHSSYVNEAGRDSALGSNERLEFLGDSVLSVAISTILFERFPDMEEGELTAIRARCVNKRALADISASLSLGELVVLGKGEERSGGRENPSILADTFEALLGVIYLEVGLEKVSDLVEDLFAETIEQAASGRGHADYKSALQELTQRLYREEPAYLVVDEAGPAHNREFTVEARLRGRLLGRSSAKSKKEAEQGAAREALHSIEEAKEEGA